MNPFPHPFEGDKMIKVPPGVKHGTKLRLKGLGFPTPGNKNTKGDLYAIVNIEVPKSLSDDQIQIAKSLAAAGL